MHADSTWQRGSRRLRTDGEAYAKTSNFTWQRGSMSLHPERHTLRRASSHVFSFVLFCLFFSITSLTMTKRSPESGMSKESFTSLVPWNNAQPLKGISWFYTHTSVHMRLFTDNH